MDIEKIRNIGLDKLVTQVYDFDSLTTDELMCKFAQKINIIIDHLKYVDDRCYNSDKALELKLQFLLGQGLEEQVAKRLLELINNGTLGKLINETLLGDINNQLHNIVHQVKNKNELLSLLTTIQDNHTISIENDIELSEELYLKDNITITGKGTLSINTTFPKVFDLSNKKNITFKDLKIVCNGNELDTYTQAIFFMNNSENIRFINCDIVSNNRNIFSFNESVSSFIEIKDNKLKCNGAYSFVLFSKERNDTVNITTKGNNNVKIHNNYIYETDLGLLLDIDDSKIINNSFYKVNAPIACLKVKNTSINGNNLKAFVSNGICVGNGTDNLIINVTVNDNVLDGCDYDGTKTSLVHGINVYKQGGDGDSTGENQPNNGLDKGITIVGNAIMNCKNSGIFAYGNGNMTISSNSCMNGSMGIMVSGGGGVGALHPGKTIVSNNIIKNNDNGISIGSAKINTRNCLITNNIVVDNTYRGMYIARSDDSIITDNIIRDNGGCGLFVSSTTHLTIKNNTIKGNMNATDPEGFNGQVAFGVSDNNEIVMSDNIIDTTSSLYYISPNPPKYIYNNKGIRNNDSFLLSEGYTKEVSAQTCTINIPLPTAQSSWSGGQLLVQASGNRKGSSNVDMSHCLIGIVNLLKMGETINIGSCDVIYKTTNSVGTITCTANAGADNQSIDITVNTNYASTDWLYVTVKPMKSLLFINNF